MSDEPSDTSSQPPARRPRVLIVDDQPVNIRLVHQILAESHEVFMATGAEQALRICERSPPDIILLDVVMPGIGGLELCRMMKDRADTADIPVIFVTANHGESEENACWEAGGVDFVTKPVNPTTLSRRMGVHLTLKFQADRLRNLAFVDGLTGIANRRQFDERIRAELSRCSRSRSPLALLLVDVDFFKRYNDRHGHQGGDDCLRQVAAALKVSLLRPGDLAARYGGEEFACLLPETDAAGARTVGERLVAAVRALQIEHGASDAAAFVTVSVGAAVMVPSAHESDAALIAEADAQLYRAKREGRNRLCVGS